MTKGTSSWQPDADQTLAQTSLWYMESSLFLSDVPFNMFLFTVSHPCVGGYFGWLGLLIVREELYLECNCFYFHMY